MVNPKFHSYQANLTHNGSQTYGVLPSISEIRYNSSRLMELNGQYKNLLSELERSEFVGLMKTFLHEEKSY